jgi:hypothetical protein
VVDHQAITGDVSALLQIQRTGVVLDVDDVRVGRVREAEQFERTVHRRAAPALNGSICRVTFGKLDASIKPGLVTVAGRPSATLKPKTEASIPKQALLGKEER